jgi:uncharacterized protein (DUF305 family)
MSRLPVSAVVLSLFAAACGAAASSQKVPVLQPGPPGTESREISPQRAVEQSGTRYTAADVSFMQGMIHHHAQALDMTELLQTRTDSDDMRKLGTRIAVSQADEIRMMQQWLAVRGQRVPGPHPASPTQHDARAADAHYATGAPLMPGMLTPEEMNQLAQAKGQEFDRLFLKGMIKHHAGALIMVQDLFAAPGAGQDPEIFAFASDVDADQRMEIARMGAMLEELQK